MRLWRPSDASVFSRPVGAGFAEVSVSEYIIVALFMYDSARVRAPAIWVVLVVARSVSVVVDIRLRRDVRRLSSMRAKGRYLFASLRLLGVLPSISTSLEVEGDEG